MAYQTFTALRRGYTHPLFCEDFLFTHQLGDRFQVMAVMDGSSMGETSFFASTLVAKLLRRVCTQIVYLPVFNGPLSLPELGELLIKQLFDELKQARNTLFLSQEETLTTLLLAITDQTLQQSWVMAVGDGVLLVNDHLQVFNQDNQPDYLGYHLHCSTEEWWRTQPPPSVFSQVNRLVLATDGLLAIDFVAPPENIQTWAQRLLTAPLPSAKPHALDQLLSGWLKSHEGTPQDDIAIVCLQQSSFIS